MEALKKLSHYDGPRGPVILAIMDGVGIGAGDVGDMVTKASTPSLDWLAEHGTSAHPMQIAE